MTTPALPLDDLTDYSTLTYVDGLLVFDLTNRVIRGADVPIEWVLRSWVTLAGTLPWAPSEGRDITLLENTTISPGEAVRWQMALGQTARAVDYVIECAVTVEFDDVARTFTARGNVTLVDGRSYPFAVRIGLASGTILANVPRASA